jgi:large subunit ribosomal protein L6
MSRIGKMPILIPDKVKVTIKDQLVTVKGPLGELSQEVDPSIELKQEDGNMVFIRKNEERQTRCYHGLYRSLIANMVTGVSTGYTKQLEMIGVGYRAEVKGKELVLLVGFSHPVNLPVPSGIKIDVDKQNNIKIEGIDKQLVGETAAQIRRIRPPEPYKGKGIRYTGEYVRRKAGKSATV